MILLMTSLLRFPVILTISGLVRRDFTRFKCTWLMQPEKQQFLFQDHLAEILSKWDNIDDEIWAKVIVLERNRRTAKAYARAPVLTVNGSDDGFDGFRFTRVFVIIDH